MQRLDFITAGGVMVAQQSGAGGQSGTLLYHHRDHLGSVAVLTAAEAAALEGQRSK